MKVKRLRVDMRMSKILHGESTTEYPSHHQRPAALEYAGLSQSGAQNAVPRPTGAAGHALSARVLSQSDLHAHARQHHHRKISEPAWRVLAGYQSQRERTHRRRRFSKGRLQNVADRQGSFSAD